MNALKQSLYTLLIGLMVLVVVWLSLITFAERIDNKSILQWRIEMAREEMREVHK